MSESFDSTRRADAGGGKPPPEPAERTMPAVGRDDGAPKGPPPPPQDPLIGQEIGGCRIDDLLGRGAMGAVYKAKQLRLDREVAVKVIRPELLTDARMLKRFEQEARTVGRFNSPHVVMVHDVGFERGVHFLVMELVKGKNLRDYTKLLAGGRLPVAEALPLLRQACKGLEEAQRLAVLHRDIKPDNLMLTDRGVLKIADFGIAKPMHDDFSMTMTSELIGTPLYMSPEQCQAAPDLDFRSDMYSLGATFYYLLTGEPPIRASSVYELIQTKTKLEHLSLWKALPELDENHPLSRVIERMTALDRADRYESYEALVGDLVLVQQGRTMEIQRPKSRQATRAPAPPPRRRNGAAVAGVVVLVLGLGGGGAWYLWGQQDGGTPPVAGGGNGGTVATPLPKLRERLRDDGPSPALRDEVQAKPASVELPFAALREHFVKVGEAAAVGGTPGPELQQWLAGAREQALAAGELGAQAESALLAAFATWQQDRLRAGNDLPQLAELGKRLDAFEAARRDLLEILPRLTERLQQSNPLAAIATARQGLATEVVAPATDVAPALAELREQFAERGPEASLRDRLDDLRPTVQDQVEARDRLLNEFQRAGDALTAARNVRSANYPHEPKLPFDDVAGYFAALAQELQPLAQPESELPAWATKARDELRDEVALQGKVVARCKATWAEWQQRRGQPNVGAAELAALEIELRTLQDGLRRARELFPAAAAALDAAVPAATVNAAATGLGAEVRRQQWLAGARETVRQLGIVARLGDWRTAGPRLGPDLARHRTEAGDFATDPEVAAELQRGEQIAGRWRDAEARIVALARALAAGDLPAAEKEIGTSLAGAEGAEEWKAFGDAARACLDAFTVLDQKLDVGPALVGLEAAKKGLLPHRALSPEALARIDRWLTAVQALQRAAAGMVPIAGGRTKVAPEQVAAFFLSRTECTQAEFAAFLDELDAHLAGLADPQARLDALKPRLGELALAPETVAGLLSRRGKLREPKKPVDAVSFYDAAACAKWRQQSLPTAAEWALAAFGDGHQHDFPWGGREWQADDASRNIGNTLVDADAGGRSWRNGGASIHHLAGNVAEWLQPAPGATDGRLAGGRCTDTRKEQEQRARGEDFHKASLSRDLPGFGFRTVLRVRDFLAPHFADGRYPVRAR